MLGDINQYLEKNDDGVYVNPITERPVTKLGLKLWNDFKEREDVIYGYSITQLAHVLLMYDASCRGVKVNLVGLIKESGIGVSSYLENKKLIEEIRQLENNNNNKQVISISDLEVLSIEDHNDDNSDIIETDDNVDSDVDHSDDLVVDIDNEVGNKNDNKNDNKVDDEG